MENARFRAAEKISDFEIPFSLDDDSLSDWLNDLMALDCFEATEKLFHLIETLNKTPMPGYLRFVFFKKIGAYIGLLVEQRDKKFLELSFPLPQKEKESVEMIAWCYLGHARGFSLVAEKVDDKAMQVTAWYMGLSALSQAYLQMAAIYCMPSKGFWRLCYHIYRSAEQAEVLKESLTESGQEHQTIDNKFKQIVLFSLSDSNQFRAREMKVVFQFIGKYVSQISVKNKIREDRKKGTFVFDLSQDWQPVELANLSNFKELDSTRYIATVVLAKNMFQDLQHDKIKNSAIKSLNKALLMRLIKTLGMAQIRKSTRIDENRICNGIVGFGFLCSFLRSKSGEINTEQKINKDKDLELLLEGEEHAHQMRTVFKDDIENNEQIRNIFQLGSEAAPGKDVWSSSVNADKNALIENVKSAECVLINSSAKGYSLDWNNQEDRTKLGDIFGIISTDSNRLEISLIRRISQISDNNVRLGIEVIGFESTPVYITRPDNNETGMWTIFLPGIKALQQADSLVFKTGDYEIGEFITLQQKNEKRQCRLTKLLNSTQAVSHAELFYVPEHQ